MPPEIYPNEECDDGINGWLAEITGRDGDRRRVRFMRTACKPVWLHKSVLHAASTELLTVAMSTPPKSVHSADAADSLGVCAPLLNAVDQCASASMQPGSGGYHLCAGDTLRKGCFSAVARRFGLPCRDFEKEVALGGGSHGDLFVDATFCSALAEAEAGGVRFVVGGPPCQTGTAVRFLRKTAEDHGPPVLRRQQDPDGEHCPAGWRMEVEKSNALNRRFVAIAQAVHKRGGYIVLETPACQGEG